MRFLKALTLKITRLAATFSFALSIPGYSAMAETSSIPRYAVEKYCQEVSDFGGGSNSLYNSCIEMEQNAYNDLKVTWASLPSKARNYCDEVARFGGGSYSLLESCIKMETSAGSNTSAFEY